MGLGVSHVRKDVRILQACTRIYTRVVLRVRFLSSQVGRELRTKHATCAQFFFACLTIFFSKIEIRVETSRKRKLVAIAKNSIFLPDGNVLVF